MHVDVLFNRYVVRIHSPESGGREIDDFDDFDFEGKHVNDHAEKAEEVNGERRALVGPSLVQDEAAQHGADHAAQHDYEADATRVLSRILRKNGNEITLQIFFNQAAMQKRFRIPRQLKMSVSSLSEKT